MKFFKKIIVKIIHSLGFDVFRIPKNFENNFLGLNRQKIRSIIDVGANTGQFAKKALGAFPEASIYCFEPLSGPFSELEEMSKKEKKGRMFNFNLGIGEKEQEVEMFYCPEHNDSSSILEHTDNLKRFCPETETQKKVLVKITTLDKVMGSLSKPLSSDILIKVDTEGYEDRVLQGGQKTLSLANACILEISLEKLHEGQPSFKKIFSQMQDLGFRYAGNLNQICDVKYGHVLYIDAVFLKDNS